MKRIKKIGKTVAGSALLVGATLAGAATMGAAQSGSSGMTLGDYPQPFVNDEGEVDSTIVVGENAKTIDVVAGMNIAGSLGNAAFSEEQVSATGGNFGWSASNGVTLDTRNDQLYFNDVLTEVRDTLTQEQLESLEEVEFRDDDGDSTDIEFYLYPDNKQMQFGKPDDRDNEDPVHYVDNPESVSASDNLFRLQANMEDEINFTAEDVQDEEIMLFGREYTVSTETDADTLILFGGQDQISVDSGSSQTITVNGEEVTLEVVGVTGSNTAAIRVNGNLREENEDDKFTVNGQEIRVSDIIQTNSDNSQGTVQFSIGSEELRLDSGNAIEDENEDEIDGTYVEFNGGTGSGEVDQLSTLTIAIGSNDDDQEYVMAGESYSHPLFENYEFHFGGLNPNAAEGGDSVSEVEVAPNGDDTITASFETDEGESASLDFIHNPDETTSSGVVLADSDDEAYHPYEGANATEDEYVTADAGDFAHVWEVTNIDRDTVGTSLASDDEATVDLRDAVTGDTVEVDLDSDNGENVYEGTEVIDGQTYYFELQSDTNDPNFALAYGDGAGFDGGTGTYGPGDLDVGDRLSLYQPLDTMSAGSMALHDDLTLDHAGNATREYELPSTESTDSRWVSLNVSTNGNFLQSSSSGVSTSTGGSGQTEVVNATVSGGVTYAFYEDHANQQLTVNAIDSNGANITSPSAVFLEAEDDNDNEQGYVFTHSYDNNDDELDVNDATYTGSTRQEATLESNDDVDAAVDFYGAYSEYDSDEQGAFNLWVPNGQSVEGAAFTSRDGELSAGGSAGSVTTMQPTGYPDAAALDSEISGSDRNQNMILVGGPAVNSLVQELASENMTMTTQEYLDEGEGFSMVQLVEDAFTQGNDALVVAGTVGEDTREAGNYIANYEDNSDELAGQSQVTVSTGQ